MREGPIHYGFVRVAAISSVTTIGNCQKNAENIIEIINNNKEKGISVMVFPELCITGYTCGDLFHQNWLQQESLNALKSIVFATRQAVYGYQGLVIVGLPLNIERALYNVAVVIHDGSIIAIVPKVFLANYNEFYEKRWFANAFNSHFTDMYIPNVSPIKIPVNSNIQIIDPLNNKFSLAVEICEDLWGPIQPSGKACGQGASIVVNLSASNDLVGKRDWRTKLVEVQSGRGKCGYVYSSAHCSESTTDTVYSGHCLIAENGTILQNSNSFDPTNVVIIADIDLELLQHEKSQYPLPVLSEDKPLFISRSLWPLAENPPLPLQRPLIESFPFVASLSYHHDEQEWSDNKFVEVTNIQCAGLYGRLQNVKPEILTIGLSGGADSTLTFLIAIKTLKDYNLENIKLIPYVMPGFGTNDKSMSLALKIVKAFNLEAKIIDICDIALAMLRGLGHKLFGKYDVNSYDSGQQLKKMLKKVYEESNGQLPQDLIFENIQARIRTNLLMTGGFCIGTGNLSEIALGFSTYGGDQLSMYNPNAGVPKTLIKILLEYLIGGEYYPQLKELFTDIIDQEISGELMPGQKTNDIVGDYVEVDFILYHFLRHGFSPEKIRYLAQQAYLNDKMDSFDKTLDIFFKRFFANQFKRSAMPDGPKVGSVSLSPRTDWRMPSDMYCPFIKI